MRSGLRGSLVLVLAAGTLPTVLTATGTSGTTGASGAAAGATTIRVEGLLLVSPPEEDGEPAYALALEDGDVVPVRGDLGPDPAPRSRVTADLVLPAAVSGKQPTRRQALALVDERGDTLDLRTVSIEPPAAAEVTPAVHHVYVAAPSNLGTFPLPDQAMLDLVAEAAAYWEDEADGAIVDMAVASSIVRYPATVATDANNCGLTSTNSEFFQVLEEATEQFPGADVFAGSDHVVLLGPSLCNGNGTAGRGSLGDSLAGGGVQVTHVGGVAAAGTIGHEWGHNFGLMHANIGACDDSCEREYQHLYNIMGANPGASYNRFVALGTAFRWISRLFADGEVEQVTVGDGSSPVTVTRRLAPRSAETGLRSLSVIDPDTGRRLFVEYRSGTGQDQGSAYAAGYSSSSWGYRFAPGVVIEHVDDRQAALVPAGGTLASTSLAGNTWTNASGSLSVTAGALSATGVDVTIAYAPGADWSTDLSVSISGDPVVGRWLQAETNAVGRTYQWLLDGEPVPYAEESQHLVRPEDAGRQLSVAVTEYEPGRRLRTVVSAPVTGQKGTLLAFGPPSIHGTAAVGATLTTDGAIWDDPRFDGPTSTTLQWMSGDVAVPGATGASYVVRPEDAGNRITVSDTGARDGYETRTLTSAATAVVPPPTPLPAIPDPPTPTITGTARVAAGLTADPGAWPEGTELAYQWEAGGAPIIGAGGSTYTPGPGDVGKQITVQVTGSLDGHVPTSRTSAPTAPVARATLATGTPRITGTARVGRTLRAAPGTWTAGTTLRYQWLANGTRIRRATRATLALTVKLRGKRIAVRVTGSKPGYTTASRRSAATGPVRR